MTNVMPIVTGYIVAMGNGLIVHACRVLLQAVKTRRIADQQVMNSDHNKSNSSLRCGINHRAGEVGQENVPLIWEPGVIPGKGLVGA